MTGLYAWPASTELTKALLAREFSILHPDSVARKATECNPQLVAFLVPAVPESVRTARLHVRAALGPNQLSELADDAETITSELVTNAIQHACRSGTETVGVILLRMRSPEAVAVVVTDPSAEGPAK